MTGWQPQSQGPPTTHNAAFLAARPRPGPGARGLLRVARAQVDVISDVVVRAGRFVHNYSDVVSVWGLQVRLGHLPLSIMLGPTRASWRCLSSPNRAPFHSEDINAQWAILKCLSLGGYGDLTCIKSV